MAATDRRVKVETCLICFDDFELITLAGVQDEDEDLDDYPFMEPFFAPGDFYDDDEVDQLALALHLSTLEAQKEAKRAQYTSTSSSRPPLSSQQRDTRPRMTAYSSSTSAYSTSTSTSASMSTSTSASTPPSPYYPPGSLGLGFSLTCNKVHLYCSDCLNKYIETKLQSKVWPIVCPDPNCKGSIPPRIVESLMGEKSTKWYDLSLERAVRNKVSTRSSLPCTASKG